MHLKDLNKGQGGKVKGGGREEQPPIQGAVAARAQECLEELLHIQGQEGRRWDDTPHQR